MKKALSVLVLAIMLVTVTVLPSLASETDATVYVTVSNGTHMLAYEAIVVTDIDSDGTLTINDALYCAHQAKYVGGASAGYATAQTEYGLSLTKLWGNENGSGYGYYVNNASAMGLADPVKNGDHVAAFVYTDTAAWSDTYCFFDKTVLSGKEGDSVTLTLSAAGYDANWMPVTLPVANATVTVNGEPTTYTTDAEGKVTIPLDQSGRLLISAVSASQTLVPPICVADVEAAAPITTTPTTNASPDSPSEPSAPSAPSVSQGQGSNTKTEVVFGVIALVIAVVACLAFVVLYWKNNKKNG